MDSQTERLFEVAPTSPADMTQPPAWAADSRLYSGNPRLTLHQEADAWQAEMTGAEFPGLGLAFDRSVEFLGPENQVGVQMSGITIQGSVSLTEFAEEGIHSEAQDPATIKLGDFGEIRFAPGGRRLHANGDITLDGGELHAHSLSQDPIPLESVRLGVKSIGKGSLLELTVAAPLELANAARFGRLRLEVADDGSVTYLADQAVEPTLTHPFLSLSNLRLARTPEEHILVAETEVAQPQILSDGIVFELASGISPAPFALSASRPEALELPRGLLTVRRFAGVEMGPADGIVAEGPFEVAGPDGSLVLRNPSFSLVRPEDLLVIDFSLINLEIPLTGAARIVRSRQNEPAYLVADLGVQHLAEQTYPAGPVGSTPPTASLPAKLRAAARTRLVFQMPGTTDSIPLATADILNACRQWSLSVSANAAIPFQPPNPVVVAPPKDSETSIEAPFRMVLSPDRFAHWQHALLPVTRPHPSRANLIPRTELWHTRLTKDGPLFLRAIWARDNDGGSTPEPFEGSVTPAQRKRIVEQSMQFSRFAGNPPGVSAERVHLSALGATMDVHYLASPPVDLHPGEEWISEWRHQMGLGRDSFVRVVQEGFLYPFGNRAVLVDITQRGFESGAGGAADRVAPLRKSKRIVVLEPEKTYLNLTVAENADERLAAFASVRFISDDVQVFSESQGFGGLAPDKAFVPRTVTVQNGAVQPGDDVVFAVLVTDRAGRKHSLSVPVVFVSRGTSTTPGDMAKVVTAHEASLSRFERPFDRQSDFAIATPSKPGAKDTDVRAVSPLLKGRSSQLQSAPGTPFYPTLSSMEAVLPAVEALAGAGTKVRLELLKDYVDKGFNADNRAALFAKVVTDLKAAFPGDLAGGVAVPNINAKGLSRALGVVGETDKLFTGQFDPKQYFDTSAKLLGEIALSDIIDALTFDSGNHDKLPHIQTRPILNTDGLPVGIDTLIDWSTPTKPDPIGLFQPLNEGAASKLTLSAHLAKRIDGQPGSFVEVRGDLTEFRIRLIPSAEFVKVDFRRLSFVSRDGGKPTIDVDLKRIDFGGALAFVAKLAEFLKIDGSKPILDVDVDGVLAGFALALPRVAFGAFSLQNISLGISVRLPFSGQSPLAFAFSFGQRTNPFIVSVGILGGGGYFALELSPKGLVRVEAALEFGGYVAFDIGVASGCVYILAGIRFLMRDDPQGRIVVIEGYLRAGGMLQILGIVTLSITFYMGLRYLPESGDLWGQAEVTVSIKIAFFSKSVTLHVERRFAGSGRGPSPAVNSAFASALAASTLDASTLIASGPPRFEEMMEQTHWDDYCAAFAA